VRLLTHPVQLLCPSPRTVYTLLTNGSGSFPHSPLTHIRAHIYTHWAKLFEGDVILIPTVSRPVCHGICHPPGAHDRILIAVAHFQFSSYKALFLNEECVCNLLGQLVLDLASAVTLGSTPAELLGSHSVGSYDLQGSAGGILTPFHRVGGGGAVDSHYVPSLRTK
jgi:hypothetical protein